MTLQPEGTVLIVEDDSSVLRALSRLLRLFDLHVLTFSSAETFLGSEVPAGKICLLLDIYLPGMSGIDLCKVLAASGRSIPTILMSAHDDEITKRMARDAAAVRTLYKPFDEDVLLDAIHRALGTKQV